MQFGQNDTPAAPHGRAAVPSPTHGGLTASSAGIMPSAAHDGLSRPHTPLHHRQSCGPRAGAPSGLQQSHPRGRRHLDPHHFTNFSDDAKRQAGRYGRAHVSSEQQQKAAAYYSSRQPSVPQPPGAECNLYLKSYYYTPLSKADGTSPPPKAPTGGFRPDAQSTSFQVAEARLRQLRREHPEYRPEVDKVLQEQRGHYEIVSTQQKLSRKAAVAEYAEDSDARVRHIAETTKYHGEPDLGSPAPAIERSIPYAISELPGRKDTQLSSQSHVRLYEGRNKSSSPAEPSVKPHDRHLHDGPAPYDSADLSRERYPSPPPVGVRQGLYAKPTMVRIDEQRRRQCGEDADTLALKRARAKSGPSVSQDRQQDPIFGSGPAPHAPRPTLAQRTEARWKAQERTTEARRSGRALYPQSYQFTSLW